MDHASQSPALAVHVNKPAAVYAVSEPIVFRVEAASDAPAASGVPYTVTWDGAELIERGALSLTRGACDIVARPGKAGFVRLRIGEETAAPIALAAAAVAPDTIVPSLPVPDDFDEFWARKFAPLRAVPLEAEMLFHAECADAVTHAVRVSMPDDTAVYGWLHQPKTGGSHPALVLYHGAGVYAIPPEIGLDWAAHGFIVLSINPHSIPNDQPRDYYVDLREGALADYRTRGRESRETLSFVPMFLRAVRAVDFVVTLPDWDGRRLIAVGHSQGGGQALAAAALNPKVAALTTSCCTHCDHTGPVIGRPAGWPRIVEMRDGVPDPAQVEAARYIDGVNFASRVHCPTFFSVGFLDDLCPPTGIYAVFNALPGPKMIQHEITVGHVHTDDCKEAQFRWAQQLDS